MVEWRAAVERVEINIQVPERAMRFFLLNPEYLTLRRSAALKFVVL
jgi:hypothetical protein